eukprot:scaffold1214_cov349-Prasinococcus_capsulatus_cf.AAC.5
MGPGSDAWDGSGARAVELGAGRGLAGGVAGQQSRPRALRPGPAPVRRSGQVPPTDRCRAGAAIVDGVSARRVPVGCGRPIGKMTQDEAEQQLGAQCRREVGQVTET